MRYIETQITEDETMVATTMVHVRVNEEIKQQAAETLAKMGLTVSDAVRVFLTRVVADAEVENEAYATAARIAAGGPAAARANKRWVRRLSVAPAPLTEAEVREHFAFFDSDEYREGVRSFITKTRPDFK